MCLLLMDLREQQILLRFATTISGGNVMFWLAASEERDLSHSPGELLPCACALLKYPSKLDHTGSPAPAVYLKQNPLCSVYLFILLTQSNINPKQLKAGKGLSDSQTAILPSLKEVRAGSRGRKQSRL